MTELDHRTRPGFDTVDLDGESLTLEALAALARDPRIPVRLAPAALERVERASRLIRSIAERYAEEFGRFERGETAKKPVQDYGITTGFGEFKDVPIPPSRLEDLQRNLLLSHATGAGLNLDADDPSNYYPPEVVRAVLALRLNTFLKGHSGLRTEMVEAVAAMLNRGIVPLVPLHGSVGSSGDLCPLSHLFVPFVGHGRYAVVREPAAMAWGSASRPWKLRQAGEHLAEDLGFAPPSPSFKESLALINGATFSAAMLALAVYDAELLARAADLGAALSLEAVCGCARALDPKIHAARGQRGQIESAAHLRKLLAGSKLLDSAGAVQDLYSLRCAPAVHGASRDAIAYARATTEREINAATDNPLFFPGDDGAAHGEPPWDLEFRANWPAGYRGEARASYSAGNFHGQPMAVAADVLAIALAELADISERRTQLLLDRDQNRGLPPNLVADAGVQSGLMLLQYGAAGLVSENKVLAHPASVDSIPTAAGNEDHNAMATIAARKLRTVAANTQAVLAIELLTAAQAIDWRAGAGLPPRRNPPPPGAAPADPFPSLEAFRAATTPDRRPAIAAKLGRGTAGAYLAIRGVVEPVVEDRPLDADLLALRKLIAGEGVGRGLLELAGKVHLADGYDYKALREDPG